MSHKLIPIITLLLGACAATPVYQQPSTPDIEQYTPEAVSAPHDQAFSQKILVENWWLNFGSNKLNQLIENALANSPNLQAQQAKLEQAQFQQQAFDRGSSLPQINAQLSPQRMRNNAAPLGMEGGQATYNLYQANILASYNLDLSGANKQTLTRLMAQVDYQRFQLAGARQTLISQLLLTIIQQAQLSEQRTLLDQLINLHTTQLHIVEQQLNIGSVNLPAVLSLKQQLNNTQSQRAELEKHYQHSRHQLAVLSGKAPSDTDLPSFNMADLTLPYHLPVSLPSDLLKQRPDIRAAEAMLQAATAQQGIAISKLYPQINLSAGIGSQALSTGALFGSGAMIWQIAGQLLQPLFNPSTKQEIKAAEAGKYAAAAYYQQTVIQAFGQIADQLRTIESNVSTQKLSQENLALSQQQYDLIEKQQQIGSANELQVLQAKQQLTQQQLAITEQQAARLINSVALYQAVGGVWEQDKTQQN